jgi:hypothetical protein
MFSLSDLNQTKTTGLFGCFGLEIKTEVCPTSRGVDDLPFLQKNHTFLS